jgi:DNA adenine methylase
MNTTKTVKFVPAIKWSGSKRSQVSTILKYIPSFDKYYEPFIGGGSVAYAVEPQEGICGDNYSPLIEFWNKVKNEPDEFADSYSERCISFRITDI